MKCAPSWMATMRVELVLDHAGADGGEAFVEGHGVFLGLTAEA